MSDGVTYREATRDELSICATYWYRMFEDMGSPLLGRLPEDWHERWLRVYRPHFDSETLRYDVACIDNRIVGTSGASIRHDSITDASSGRIFGVYVERAYRGRGIAARLAGRSLAWLRKCRCAPITLRASETGRPIYECLGFKPVNEMQIDE
ncbi:MAG TPA: GNAT family N-acetyltransferase [Verrucomicrobiae bacterium]|jgi:GNAT superfamily N-acetyltransferase|nr:GNAT family N-acetyltransferase [Verrucomicrobiae bacterium]